MDIKNKLGSIFNITEYPLDQLWENITIQYKEPHRHYHTWSHISYMFENFPTNYVMSDAMFLSILFHDIVYDSSRKDNEEASAEQAFETIIKYTQNVVLANRVKEMILATKTHFNEYKDEEILMLLDLDLAVLAADENTYKTYSENVRKEYKQYPDLLYKPGRKEVLKKFLGMKEIYRSDFFKTKEDLSRKNLQMEIDSL